jgi:hypothetical protein
MTTDKMARWNNDKLCVKKGDIKKGMEKLRQLDEMYA